MKNPLFSEERAFSLPLREDPLKSCMVPPRGFVHEHLKAPDIVLLVASTQLTPRLWFTCPGAAASPSLGNGSCLVNFDGPL